MWSAGLLLLGALTVQEPTYERAIDSARVLAQRFLEREGASAISVAVGIDGAITWAEAFGWADRAREIPADTVSMFRIGSVSKPLTAALLGLLVEEGVIDLDAPIQRYVPDFPVKRWPVTTRQLAGHLAGIRHYRGAEFLLNRPFATVREGLTIFEQDSLLHEPGTRYAYSSYGWNLISAVIEGATGEPFLALMQRRVFGPLDMRHTAPDRVDSVIPERTAFYSRAPGGDGMLVEGPAVDNSYKWAGGGFLSTPNDLMRFAFAHFDPVFLRAETLALLFTSQRTAAGEPVNYGVGWRVGADRQGRRWVGHGGGSIGGATMLVIYPDVRTAVVVTANLSGANVAPLAHRIAGLFMGEMAGQ